MLRVDPNACSCNPWMREACFGDLKYKDEAGRRFCVLHFPNKAKAAQFRVALDAKLENNDPKFSGVWFPEYLDLRARRFLPAADFRNATFAEGADFCGVHFKRDAHFSETTFIGRALFSETHFDGASNFVHAEFHAETSFCLSHFSQKAEFAQVKLHRPVDFAVARFAGAADFSHATFMSDVSFRDADFLGPVDFTGTEFGSLVSFDSSTVRSYMRFASDGQREVFSEKSVLDLQHCRITRAEEISFHTVLLRPNWFVNVDTRKFAFAEIRWDWKNNNIKKEIKRLVERHVTSPHALLATACRQLAENAESNNRYEDASKFRYLSMDLLRGTKWFGAHFWRTDLLHMLYWLVSGYGERIWRALLWLLAVWLVFAWAYTWVGFSEQLSFPRSFTHSLGVMSLQKPEPRPLTDWAHALVAIETILGPVQGALLLLAIRRKFMR